MKRTDILQVSLRNSVEGMDTVSKCLRSDYNLTLGAAINRSKSSSIKSADCILSASQRHHWHHQVHANWHQKQSIVQAASATVGHYS